MICVPKDMGNQASVDVPTNQCGLSAMNGGDSSELFKLRAIVAQSRPGSMLEMAQTLAAQFNMVSQLAIRLLTCSDAARQALACPCRSTKE
jgi:hypothetical protein